MDSRHFWDDNGQSVKYDNYASNDGFGRVGGDQLNFAAPSEDEAEYPPGAYLKKGKVSRQDPMSHRIIEKRRRDRMNNCLADLSRMIPPEYLKKGRGRVEKTEIIEMAIRHLKYLQDRANVVERQREDAYRAGYQEAVGEAMRFLVEIQGYAPGDGLCVSLTSHLQRHVEIVTKGEMLPREKHHHHSHATGGSSSETTSSSGSSHGFVGKPGVIAQAPPPAPPTFPDHYGTPADVYNMECDRVSVSQMPVTTDNEILPEVESLPLDGRRKRSPTLRAVRKFDHTVDFLHSYKFKNSIQRRFSRSQDNEAAESPHVKSAHYTHKRRRAARPALPAPPTSTSASNSGSTEEARDTSPQDTSSESPHHHHYDKALTTTGQHVPIFALNTHGKYYIPLSIEYSCLAHHIGPFDLLDARAVNLRSPLHPVTIHVNFHPFLNYHMKREQQNEQDWRPS